MSTRKDVNTKQKKHNKVAAFAMLLKTKTNQFYALTPKYMYFLVEEKFSQSDDFTKSVATLVSQYHGVTFFEWEEMINFIHHFISKVKSVRAEYADTFEYPTPSIRYIPQMISGSNWVDVTILIDDMAICRIVKAKKEVVKIEIVEVEKEVSNG